MELDSGTLAGFAGGIAVGALLTAVLFPLFTRRLRERHQDALGRYDEALYELRRDGADDREVNRHLRHQLAINTPEELELTRGELDQAHADVRRLQEELEEVAASLNDRDRSLREARLAIQEIRLQLERDRVDPAADDGAHAGDRLVPVDDDGERTLSPPADAPRPRVADAPPVVTRRPPRPADADESASVI